MYFLDRGYLRKSPNPLRTQGRGDPRRKNRDFSDDRPLYGWRCQEFPADAPGGQLLERTCGSAIWATLVEVSICSTRHWIRGQPWDKHLNAKPIVIDSRITSPLDPSPRGGQCTGLLRLWDDVLVRYSPARHQRGWKHAGDFRPCRRRELVPRLITAASPIFQPALCISSCSPPFSGPFQRNPLVINTPALKAGWKRIRAAPARRRRASDDATKPLSLGRQMTFPELAFTVAAEPRVPADKADYGSTFERLARHARCICGVSQATSSASSLPTRVKPRSIASPQSDVGTPRELPGWV